MLVSSIYMQKLQNGKAGLNKITALLCVCFFCIFSAFAQSAQPEANAAERHVFDLAGLLSGAEAESLEDMFAETCANGFYIGFLTADDTQGLTSEAFADDFYDYYIYDSQPDGVICLIDMDNRKIQLSTSGTMINYLTDVRIEKVLDDVFPYVKNGDYSGAAKAFNASVVNFYRMGIPSGQYRYEDTGPRVLTYTPVKALIALLAGIIMGAIFCGTVKGSYAFRKKTYEYPFSKLAAVDLAVLNDNFIGEHTVQHVISTSSSASGSSGSRSTVHHSSSGHSHGGGGRSF